MKEGKSLLLNSDREKAASLGSEPAQMNGDDDRVGLLITANAEIDGVSGYE